MPIICRFTAPISGRCTNSRLNGKGLPQVAVGHVELPDTSLNLVESKSFKLYLNSFNQTRFASWQDVAETLTRDLSACAQGKVKVSLYRLDELEGQPIARLHGTCIDDQDIEIDNYQFSADYLQGAASGKIVEETLVSHLLKSNCLITHQPDWGSVQIQYRGRKSTASSSCAIWFRSATITNSMSSASNVSLTIFSVSASRNRFPFTPAIRDAAVWISTLAQQWRLFPRHRPPRPSIINNFTICVRLGARKVVETPFAGLL